MAITLASPEEDLRYRSQGMNIITPLLPTYAARDVAKNALPGQATLDFGIGDLPLNPNDSRYSIALDNTYKAFNDAGVGVLDPRNPLGRGGSGGGSMTGFSADDLLKKLLTGGGSVPGTGGATPTVSSLPGASKGMLFSDLYKPPADNSADKYFQDYLNSISAPSSTEEALKGVESQGLDQLLADIDRETNQNVASAKLDALDRGLGGPGQYGDIEANAVAQARAGGARTKAGARTSVLTTQLGRQAEKEKAKTTALGQRYQTGAASDLTGRQIAASGAMSDAQILSSLLGKQYEGGITQGEGAANRASTEKINTVRNLLDYAVETGKMSQQDRQFYDQLMAQAEQNALNRTSDYNRTLAGRSPERDNTVDYLNSGINLLGLFI